MKNMYLAAAMVVSLAFSACSDEESGKADRAYKPIEIFGNINEVVNNVQETRAVGAAWGSDDRIGVTVEADEDNATANAVDTYINIQYRNETGGSFRVVNEGSTDNNIRLKGEGEFTLNAYYPYQGANGTLPGTEGVIAKTISGADQTTDKQPQIDFLFAQATGVHAESPVTFDFSHKMTKIILKFKAPNGATLNNMKVYLKSLQLEGSFNVTTGEAVAKSGATPNSELSMDIAKPAEGEMTASIILFPQDMPEKVLLEVRMNDETYTQYMPVQNLESGHAYPYNVTFENPAMTITKAEIEDWIVEDDKDVTASVTE